MNSETKSNIKVALFATAITLMVTAILCPTVQPKVTKVLKVVRGATSKKKEDDGNEILTGN